jgi:UDP-glucose 4-epimerase
MSTNTLTGRKLLVTGGAGYIGSVCVERLVDSGCVVTVFDNLSEGHKAAVDPRAELLVGDLQDRSAVRGAFAAVNPDAVLHFAASALVGESMQMPGKYFCNNVVAGLNLLEAMVEAGVKRLVFSSSCATYGLPHVDLIDELAPQVPINPYGESKLIFEQMVRWFDRAHGLTSVGLRFFNVGGASRACGEDHRVETHLIPNLLKVALKQKASAAVYGRDYDTLDGTCVRDYVHVLDVVSAHLAAITTEQSGNFNLGSGCGHSVSEVVACCREVTGHEIPVVYGPRRPGDPSHLSADIRKIERLLRWRPRHSSVQEIVRSAWAWHRAHPQGYEGVAAEPHSSAAADPSLRS